MKWIAVVLAAVVLGGCGSAHEPVLEEAPAPAEAAAVETPTPTPPPPSPAAVTVRVEEGELKVSPRSVPLDRGAIELHLDNGMDETAEVILVRGAPGSNPRKVQAALVTGDAVQPQQPRLNRVAVEPGRYTLILRLPESSGEDVLDAVRLRVR